MLARVCEGQVEVAKGNRELMAWQEPKLNYVPPHKRVIGMTL